MTTIRTRSQSVLPPQHVLLAAYDFGPRRVEVWPAVRTEHFAVHEQRDGYAEVTEGTPAGVGVNWERCRYDWSQSGRVLATVLDSNVYAVPGSSWQITAVPNEGGGSVVEMTWIRRFRRTPRGLLFGTLFRVVGRPIFNSYARKVLENLERTEKYGPRPSHTHQ